ncbi:HAD-IA family hydrolase [Kitasatospora sp. NPDC090308]|uniref:HAD-IA family hydrolase n=1 Tax=Kitasatospora sp. NPDC090308 TaxID=3364082 RepID=UPI00381387C6
MNGSFDAVVLSSEHGLRKPDAALFQMVLDRLGPEAAECVFVDDSEANVEAADALGFTALLGLDEQVVARQLRELLRLPARYGSSANDLCEAVRWRSLEGRWVSSSNCTPGGLARAHLGRRCFVGPTHTAMRSRVR